MRCCVTRALFNKKIDQLYNFEVKFDSKPRSISLCNSLSSRSLFKYTLIHLPLLMTLMFISKVTRKDDSALVAIASLTY